MDATLEIALGYRETGLTMMGRFTVDGRGGEGPLQVLSIRATAADMKGAIRSPRTRAWENRSLSDIVRMTIPEAAQMVALNAWIDDLTGLTAWDS